jgi:hypothetical protein
VGKAVEAGLVPKRAMQVMDRSPMLGAAAVQDTYKLIRTALHKLVKGNAKELPKELLPQLRRYVKTGKRQIDWENAEARQEELEQLRGLDGNPHGPCAVGDRRLEQFNSEGNRRGVPLLLDRKRI